MNKLQGTGGNLYTNGVKLNSYNTVIAQWDKNILIINITGYSNTTSKQLSILLNSARLSSVAHTLIMVKDVPINAHDLIEYTKLYNHLPQLKDIAIRRSHLYSLNDVELIHAQVEHGHHTVSTLHGKMTRKGLNKFKSVFNACVTQIIPNGVYGNTLVLAVVTPQAIEQFLEAQAGLCSSSDYAEWFKF